MDNHKKLLLDSFLREHSKEYYEFLNVLKMLRCRKEAYDLYLDSFTFEYEPFGVFNISYFYEFCKANCINLLNDGVEELDFVSLTTELYDNLFNVSNDEQLFFCHPNDLFINKVLSSDINYMLNIDWNNINVDKMFFLNNFDLIKDNNYEMSMKILRDRLSILSRENPDTFNFYNVILSQRVFNNQIMNIVRAICREDFIGIDVAFNSNYIKTLKKVI